MKHNGFVLLEIIIATALASILFMMMLGVVRQSRNVSALANHLVTYGSAAALVQYQLERDLSGAFVPMQAFKPLEQAQATAVPPAGAPASATTEESANNGELESTDKEKQPAWQQLEKPFYVGAKDNHFDMLTFITSNPLDVYVAKHSGKVKPRIARVIYRLVAEDEQKTSFKLMRQESLDLVVQKAEKAQQYELAGGIKRVMVNVLVQHKDDGKEGEQAQTKRITFDSATEWPRAGVDDAKKEQERMIPNMVTITIEFWNQEKTSAHKIEFDVVLLSSPDAHKPRPKVAPASKPRKSILDEVREAGRELEQRQRAKFGGVQ